MILNISDDKETPSRETHNIGTTDIKSLNVKTSTRDGLGFLNSNADGSLEEGGCAGIALPNTSVNTLGWGIIFSFIVEVIVDGIDEVDEVGGDLRFKSDYKDLDLCKICGADDGDDLVPVLVPVTVDGFGSYLCSIDAVGGTGEDDDDENLDAEFCWVLEPNNDLKNPFFFILSSFFLCSNSDNDFDLLNPFENGLWLLICVIGMLLFILATSEA
ncbi:hypothetical protein WICMUC_005931 [Wickerhamomyces mucosus]|uniref:Uncharacterized protein n=1 Tax=Wickerhamomyces mucosus TaxID=1378264 RepID=A0A9P8P2A6_9ASCO|nr:hypothetical protein WICMUC_005931 [Wickerhamomyces mucosus]